MSPVQASGEYPVNILCPKQGPGKSKIIHIYLQLSSKINDFGGFLNYSKVFVLLPWLADVCSNWKVDRAVKEIVGSMYNYSIDAGGNGDYLILILVLPLPKAC